MKEPFIITVEHNSKLHHFEAQLQTMGYTHRFHVIVNGEDVYFERDEEGKYRATVPYNEPLIRNIDVTLLKAIADSIHAILE